jgi:hypothetical protein
LRRTTATSARGMGEDFFMGPYLDILPNILLKMIKAGAD